MGVTESVGWPDDCYTVAGITMHESEKRARYNRRVLPLTKRHFQCLTIFLTNPKRVLSKREILIRLYGEHNAGYRSERAATVMVERVRKALHAVGYRRGNIVAIKGIGYEFQFR